METRGISTRQSASHSLREAVENMVFGCGETAPGARILIVREAGGGGYYSSELAGAVGSAIRSMDLEVKQAEVAFDPETRSLPTDLVRQMTEVDLTIFLARIGDQVRFIEMPPGTRAIVSYALDSQALSSAFGTAPYRALVEIKSVVEVAMSDAAVEIRCPAGTQVSGRAGEGIDSSEDVSIRRFPMLVPRPEMAENYSGRVALCGFLTGTGTRYYEPYNVIFTEPVFALFTNGRLTGFEGSSRDVARANHQYDSVSKRFGIDRDFVHSWHAGIHPACAFQGRAADDYVRWGGSAFGNPRLLHFHTCGNYAPGEISWNVIDPTITADGVAIWEDGRLYPERVPGGAEILARYPQVAELFARPSREIGL